MTALLRGGLTTRQHGLRPGTLSPGDLLVFGAVAREGGVRRGAEVLGLPRSTVSRQLNALEKAVGGQLVSRSTRRFALTELGRTLAAQCARLEEVLKTTSDELARATSEPRGTLKVAASPVVGEELLLPVITEYLKRFPGVTLDIKLSIDFVDLRRAGFDVAVRTGPLQEAGDLFASRLGTSTKGLYASRAYLERRGTPAHPLELSKHDCVIIGERSNPAWSFRVGGSEVHVPVSGRLRVDSYRLARAAVLEGVGIGRLPDLFARDFIKRRELVPVLPATWPKTTLFAVHASGQPAPPKIRAFVSLLRAQLSGEL